jgi:hypothetical protein
MSVFLSLLLTVRSCMRSRVVRQLEVLALHHQLQVAAAIAASTVAARASRPGAVGVVVSCGERVACSAGYRQARDRHRLAPSGSSGILALEESGPVGPTVGSA